MKEGKMRNLYRRLLTGLLGQSKSKVNKQTALNCQFV